MSKRIAVCVLLALTINFSCLLSQALGHYLWVAVDAQSGTAGIYFEEGPAPGDGGYLDPFIQRGKTWIRSVDEKEPTALKTVEMKRSGKRWLSARLPRPAPRSVDSYGKWGVYRYGQTDVLLYYYARHLDVRSPEELRKLERAKHLELDIVASASKGAIELLVLWKGKPAPGRSVSLRGPKGLRKNLRTGEDGRTRFKPATEGRYTARTNVEEKDRAGTFDGKEYQMVRHHATLTLDLPLGSQGKSKTE